jgi:tRNA A37 threonylcarbamoyladenosine dehydratase
MSSEMTELMKIVLYLVLLLGGGVLVAILSILLIILIGAVGAWLVHTLRRPGSGEIRLS